LEVTNDDEDRKQSVVSEPISKQDHIRWFERVHAENDPEVYIIGDRFGLLKLSRDGEVSITILPKYRDRGIASTALREL
jgi:hypothetical protein